MTGAQATFGSTHAGVVLAIEEQNARGGLRGRPIELVSYDDRGRSQEAGTAVTRLATDDQVVAILGAATSSLSIAGAEVAQRYGVPMISPSSTNVRVTAVGDRIFRICFIDSFQSYAAAGPPARACVPVGWPCSTPEPKLHGAQGRLRPRVPGTGWGGGDRAGAGSGDQDFSAQLTSIRELGPDAVFVPGYYTDAANVAIQARRLGIAVPLLGADGWDSAQLAAIGGAAVLHTFYTNHYSPQDPSPAVQDFLRRYGARYGGAVPESAAALGYDAARILFQAMERAKSLSGEDLTAALAATEGFVGSTGTISFDRDRNARKPAVVVEMKRAEDGRILPTFVTAIQPR